MSYSRFFNQVVMAPIWREPNHVRLVWVTMVALEDRNCVVKTSISGLAHVAHVPLQECGEALKILVRKHYVEEVNDGYLVVAGEEQQRLINLDERRGYQKAWMRKKREG